MVIVNTLIYNDDNDSYKNNDDGNDDNGCEKTTGDFAVPPIH